MRARKLAFLWRTSEIRRCSAGPRAERQMNEKKPYLARNSWTFKAWKVWSVKIETPLAVSTVFVWLLCLWLERMWKNFYCRSTREYWNRNCDDMASLGMLIVFVVAVCFKIEYFENHQLVYWWKPHFRVKRVRTAGAISIFNVKNGIPCNVPNHLCPSLWKSGGVI